MNKPQKTRSWPASCWPAEDRELWIEACAGKGPHGEDIPAFSWSPHWRKMIETAYGRYVAWVADTARVFHLPPADRIDPAAVAAYVEDLQRDGLSGMSVANYIRSLRAFAGAIAPDRDWHWLARKAFRLKARAVPRTDKRLRVVSSLHLFDLGLTLMDGSASQPTALAAALQFRDGLMVALLAARPLRLGNFSRLDLGRTLSYRRPEWWLCFSEHETKTGRPINMTVPEQLNDCIDEFLSGPRKYLLRARTKAGPTAALWLSAKGECLRTDQIRGIINQRTKAHFGHNVNPHLFRDCLATSLATGAPEDILCAVPILGHTSFRMIEKHYNQATMGAATRKFASTIMELRNELIAQFDLAAPRAFLVELEGRDEVAL